MLLPPLLSGSRAEPWLGVVGARKAPEVLHFTIIKNELKGTFFLFNCSIKTTVIVLSNPLLDHLSFTVAAN